MSKNIYLYLFVFAALIALFILVSGNSRIKKLDQSLVSSEERLKTLEDSLLEAELKVLELRYFSLEDNDDALAYFEDLDIERPSSYIADKLMETNESEGDNPLVPYEGMEDPFKINKIKILNHRWIIADFSDGKYWGELLIAYELKEDLSIDFELKEHLLYTRSF